MKTSNTCLLLGTLIFVFAFLPWIHVPTRTHSPDNIVFNNGKEPAPLTQEHLDAGLTESKMAEMRERSKREIAKGLERKSAITAYGWSGTMTLSGLSIPCWLAVVAGLASSILGYMSIAGSFVAPRILLLALAGFCSLSGFYVFVIGWMYAFVGIGSLGTGLLGLVLWRTLQKNIARQ